MALAQRGFSAALATALMLLSLGMIACSGRHESEAETTVEQPTTLATQATDAVRPVPRPDEHVTVEELMSGGHVAWLTDRVLCPEEAFVSYELDFDYVTTLDLASEQEAPDELGAFLLDRFSLDVDTVEHRWIVEDRLILFKVTPWIDGDAEVAAGAIEIQRLTVAPGWAVSEAGFAYYCD